jgi:hypothetical protein
MSLFFLRKEPKIMALRGLQITKSVPMLKSLNNVVLFKKRTKNSGSARLTNHRTTEPVKSFSCFVFKTNQTMSLCPILGEADPGGLGAMSPRKPHIHAEE